MQVRCRRVLPLLRAALMAGDFALARKLLRFFWAFFGCHRHPSSRTMFSDNALQRFHPQKQQHQQHEQQQQLREQQQQDQQQQRGLSPSVLSAGKEAQQLPKGPKQQQQHSFCKHNLIS